MTVVRPYTGPDPGHPVTVVPSDPSRRGALVRVRGWEVAVADPVGAVTDGRALDEAADDLRWAGPAAAGPPFTHGLLGFVTDDASAALLDLDTVDERDPIPAYATELIDRGLLTNEDVESVQAEADAEVDAAIAFAKESPEPTAADALLHVFA